MPMNLVQIQKQLQLNDQLISKKDFKTFADNYSRDGQLFVDHGHVLQGREGTDEW